MSILEKRKGAVENYFLITIIFAIVGFMIVAYFLFGSNLSKYTEDEVCKLSVLSRATAPSAAQGAIPLKCTTKKICLTNDKNCEHSFAGEKPQVIKLGDDAKKTIEKTSADAMYDCWKMMGEGKLDLFGEFSQDIGLDSATPTCVICSRIAVDEGVLVETLNQVDINKYMEDTIIPELGVNYISAFTGKGAVSYAKQDAVKAEEFGKLGKLEENGKEIKLEGNKDNRELAIVFMQIKPKNVKDVLSNMLEIGGTVAGATFLSPVGSLARPLVLNPVGGGLAVVGAVSIAGYGTYSASRGQTAAAGYCGDFVSNTKDKDARQGCSIVQGINYNVKDINKVCPKIQGMP